MISRLMLRLGRASVGYAVRQRTSGDGLKQRIVSQQYQSSGSCLTQIRQSCRNQWLVPWKLLSGFACFVLAESEAKDKESPTDNNQAAAAAVAATEAIAGAAAAGKTSEDEVIMSIKRAKLAEMKKDLKLAEDHYHNALALLVIYQKNKMWEEARIVQARVYIYDCMANLSLANGRLADAEVLFKETLRGLMQTKHAQDDSAVLEISLKLAMIYAAQKKDEDAVQGYSFCIESLEKKLKAQGSSTSEDKEEEDNLKALLGMSVDAYSRFLISRARYPEAVECLQHALVLARAVFGEQHPQVAVLLNDLATVWSLRQDYHQARDHVAQAIKMGVATGSEDLPVFHCNLASLHTTLQDFEQAKAEYSKAIAAAKKFKDSDMEKKAKAALNELNSAQKR